MTQVFTEFENENRLRNFPFSETSSLTGSNGVELPADMFVDAMIYPVNPSGQIRISSIDFTTGEITVSDASGTVCTGNIKAGGRNIFLYAPDGRKSGVLVLGTTADGNTGGLTEYSNLILCPSCVFPVKIDGVTGIRIGDTVISGKITFEDGFNTHPEISFDTYGNYVLSLNITPTDSGAEFPSIKKIHVFEEEGTYFSVAFSDAASVQVSLRYFDRDAICAQSTRGEDLNVVDTCTDDSGIYIRPDTGTMVPAEETTEYVYDIAFSELQTFNIIAPNGINIVNAVNVVFNDGTVQPNPPNLTRYTSEKDRDTEINKLLKSSVYDNGIVLQIPGL